MPKTDTVVMPFSVLRLLLPWDGEILGVYKKKGEKGFNQWPENKGKGPFHQHDESLELAFGWILRADPKHRKKEKPMQPGMEDKRSHVAVCGGWRFHKHVPAVGDYFDGTFAGKLYLETKGNRVIPRLDGFDIEWNKNPLAEFLSRVAILPHLILSHLETDLEARQESKLNLGFAVELPAAYEKAIRGKEDLKRKLRRVSLSAKGTSLVLTFDTERPVNPGVSFSAS